MIVKIDDVPKLATDIQGKCRMRTENYAEIDISKRYNSQLSEYGVTLLHELLHLWTYILEERGAKLNRRNGHRLISRIEKTFYENLSLLK